MGWREKRVPGHTEEDTFGVVERRLLEAARDRLRDAIPEAQRGTFDTLDVTPLFGPLPPGIDQPSLRPKQAGAPTAK
jgi:hypothetical protein